MISISNNFQNKIKGKTPYILSLQMEWETLVPHSSGKSTKQHSVISRSLQLGESLSWVEVIQLKVKMKI